MSLSVKLDCKVVKEKEVLRDFGLEKVFEVQVEHKRLSGTKDKLFINISSSIDFDYKVGDFITITGDLRSIRESTEEGFLNKTYIWATDIKTLDKEPENYCNSVTGTATLIRKPFINDKNDSVKDVAELVVRVNRSHNRKSIIHCSAWGNFAKLSTNLERGDIISLEGMLLSHLYKGKDLAEVSIYKLNKEE